MLASHTTCVHLKVRRVQKLEFLLKNFANWGTMNNRAISFYLHLISYSFSWTTELQALFVVFSILGSSLSGLCEYVFYIRICTANVLCLCHGAYMDSGNCCKEWMVLQMRTRGEPPRNNPVSGN